MIKVIQLKTAVVANNEVKQRGRYSKNPTLQLQSISDLKLWGLWLLHHYLLYICQKYCI